MPENGVLGHASAKELIRITETIIGEKRTLHGTFTNNAGTAQQTDLSVQREAPSGATD